MKNLLRIPLLVLGGALAGVPLFAKVESIKIAVTDLPQYSPVMQMDGVTQGQVVFAIDVDEQGQISDTLLLGYTHRALVQPCLTAMKHWKITPAKLDGVPVAVQTELTIDFTAQGVVISSTVADYVDQRIRTLWGMRMEGRPKTIRELDRMPTRVNTVEPKYAKEAEASGVRGSVQVHFYIDSTGAVRMPSVNPDAHPYLAEAAVTAVREWKFEPPVAQGQPVLIAARQEFTFGK